ncbi:undecaprenyl-diphosphate phosphatase [Allomesorhizobium alhagi]|uniref:Undecaprenyl-diphosphatase n=1 Tax=Mesorhizobium alhagi CCNWXJ12-2 TaxID=1107882 RepID=H0I2W2_9HYPH|nr:undecaprenyl-diphosphate phosphatase [Mesorhizobium alhagi]EHK52670.1 UDP pyrophosphate phosphatase [Mesorhizobium alhagi CCNWXJ12-2]
MVFYYLVFLAVVQGITEFLPISSSAHLILGRDLMTAIGLPPAQGTAADQLAFDIALHVGSLGAVLLYFRRDAIEMVMGLVDGLTGRGGPRFRLLLLVIVGTVPILVVGFLVKDIVAGFLRATEIIAWMTLVFGIALWVADRTKTTKHDPHAITMRDAFIVGLLQCLAIIPGVSRSGITMTAGRLLGLDRPLSARFALLLAMPTIAAAGLLATYDLYKQGNTRLTADAVLGGGLAFIAAWIAVALMMRWLRHANYTPFVVYRIALGLLLLALVYGTGWSPNDGM